MYVISKIEEARLLYSPKEKNNKFQCKCNNCDTLFLRSLRSLIKKDEILCQKCRCVKSIKDIYGEEGLKNKSIREKSIQTNLKRYGVENPQQNKKINDATKQTCIKKYGVDNPAKSEFVKEKMKQSNLQKYGCVAPLQNKEIKQKLLDTNMKK